jgi:hypothetical protein
LSRILQNLEIGRKYQKPKQRRTEQLPEYSVPDGVDQVNAVGEADVHLAKQTAKMIRISGDSDCIYAIKADYVARPFRQGSSIVYKVFYYLNSFMKNPKFLKSWN